MLSSASDKTKLSAKNISKNYILDGTNLEASISSRFNVKLHNISLTPEIVKKVITELDSSKWSDPSGGSKEL